MDHTFITLGENGSVGEGIQTNWALARLETQPCYKAPSDI